MSPVVLTFVFPTLRYSPAFSLARLSLSTSSVNYSLVPSSSVASSPYLRFVTIIPPTLIPLSHSSKASLISSGERIHPCRTPFPMSMFGNGSYLKKIDSQPQRGGGVGILGGQQIKSPGNVMNCPEKQSKLVWGSQWEF